MKALLTILSFLVALGLQAQTQPTNSSTNRPRFCAVDIFIDSGATSLAAYQLEFSAGPGTSKIVGIEGGDPAAFRDAPYYDPKALQQERVIIAAFNVKKSESLPVGKTRVATIHLQADRSAQLQFALKLQVAADTQGAAIAVQATAIERQTK